MNETERFLKLLDSAPDDLRGKAVTAISLFFDFVKRKGGRLFIETSSEPVAPRPVKPVQRVAEARPVQPSQPAQEQPETQLKKELPVVHPLDAQRPIYRDQLVRKIWSVQLRKELVDRIIAVKESGVAEYEITKIIDRAKEREERDGVPSWKTLGGWCKQKYEDAGVEWTKCAKDMEPKPEPIKPTVYVNYRNEQGHSVVFPTRLLTVEQAENLSDSLDDGETTYSPQEINDRIAQYAKGETTRPYSYAC